MTDPEWPTPQVTAPHPPKFLKVPPRLEMIVLDTVTTAATRPPKSRSGKLNLLKRALRVAAEELIPAAERIVGATGEQKHQAVRKELIRVLHQLEDKLGLIPNFLEPIAFRGLEVLIDQIIKTVHRTLKARGVV